MQQHFDKILSAGLCLVLSLADRALCSENYFHDVQEHRPATSYSYFSMALPSLHVHAPVHTSVLHAPVLHTPVHVPVHVPVHAPEHAPAPIVEEDGGGEYDYVYDEHVHPKYEFKYGVEDSHTGDYKDAKEERDGDVVKGEYSLLQPDGRRRIVHYTASKHGGFNAIVSYSGHAIHPEDLGQHEY